MCCCVVILFMYKVLLYVMFEGFKAVVWCRVCSAGNNKVVRWCGGGVVIGRVVRLLWIEWYLVGWVVDRVRGWENERTLSRALPSAKLSFYNGILTGVLIPVIHITVYLILIFQII